MQHLKRELSEAEKTFIKWMVKKHYTQQKGIEDSSRVHKG